MAKRHRERVVANDLKDIRQLIPVQEEVCMDTGNYMWAYEQMKTGTCVRCMLWDKDEFMFMRRAKMKSVYDNSPEELFYKPITKELLQRLQVKRLIISKHLNRYKDGTLIVGYMVQAKEKVAMWEVYNT